MSTLTRLLFAIALLAGCSVPTTTAEIDHRGGATRVQLRRIERFITSREVVVPITDCVFVAIEEGEEQGEIWRITALVPGSDAEEVRYGSVPGGFAQVTPTVGSPPPLVPGRSYRVECSGATSALGGSTDFRIPDKSNRRTRHDPEGD
ncbi:MAG: hypothetical protein QOD06_1318 [Candidatus Binatota bacterium]|nr:hypothetical protein [Candidatus Binatota bacterium]